MYEHTCILHNLFVFTNLFHKLWFCCWVCFFNAVFNTIILFVFRIVSFIFPNKVISVILDWSTVVQLQEDALSVVTASYQMTIVKKYVLKNWIKKLVVIAYMKTLPEVCIKIKLLLLVNWCLSHAISSCHVCAWHYSTCLPPASWEDRRRLRVQEYPNLAK